MKTLLALFSEERNQLQIEIDKATSVEQVVKLVQNRLDNMQRAYIQQLNVAQVRLASFFLDTLRQSIATLAAAHESAIVLAQPKPIINEVAKVPINKFILKILQILIYVGILGSLLSLTERAPGAWMAILLTAILVGLEVVLQLDKKNRENSTNAELKAALKPIVKIDSNLLLGNLADALDTIDHAVARFGESNKNLEEETIEELPELLNLIQRLMGASLLEKPQMALELTKLLPQVLMDQGIRAQIYLSDGEHSGREYFDFEPSIDRSTKEYVTITPALFKGDRLLRRGRVIEPSYSQAKE